MAGVTPTASQIGPNDDYLIHLLKSDRSLNVQQVSGLLGCSVPTVYRLCERREIKHRRVGRSIQFRREWVEAFLQAGIVEVKSEPTPPPKSVGNRRH